MPNLQDKTYFSSWSGGKDSCLALYRARQAGATPAALLTMMAEDGKRSRSHALPLSILEAQASALSLPLVTRPTVWGDYESVFLTTLATLKDDGISDGVFGDIDLAPHREWVERVCGLAGITPHLPLWLEERRLLLDEFLAAGFQATIIVVDSKRLDPSFLGRTMDPATIADLERAGVDACGEEGEFHTVVTDGPLFATPISIHYGSISHHEGYAFLEVSSPLPCEVAND